MSTNEAGRGQAASGSRPDDEVRSFYRNYHDNIQDKRLDSPYPLRRYVHRAIQDSTLESVREFVKPGARILDAGCGEGSLVLAMAAAFSQDNVSVTGVDLSEPNLSAGRPRAGRDVSFQVADVEALPFADDSFDIVVSSHVLEHLPNFERGLAEIRRVSRDVSVLGLPTCLNPCASVILGGDNYWQISRRTPFALFLGLYRTFVNLLGEGVDEGYAGRSDLPHVWRYPWVLRRQVEAAGYEILRFEAPTIPVPYLASVLPGALWMQSQMDRLRKAPFFRSLGYGSIVVARRHPSESP